MAPVHLGRDRAPGLSEVLAGSKTFDEAVTPLIPGSLDALPSGTFPPNPSELLLLPAFAELIETQRLRYDLVVLDTAPLLAVTDGVIVSAQAGPGFLALRAGTTTAREAQVALKRLEQSGIKAAGLILNDLDAAREGGGEYHYYQYEYPTDRT